MLFKRKSIIVGLVSSIVIAIVLILTLVGYSLYLEFRAEEFKRYYQELLGIAKGRVYSGHISITGLEAKIENAGALKGKPIVEGVITNNGSKEISNLGIKVSFLDKDNAVIYEMLVRPQEPSLGSSGLMHVNTPYLYNQPKFILKPNDSLSFKKIIANCPTEMFVELREGKPQKKTIGKWSGKLGSQVMSLDF